jgi:hypothetical protein
MLDLSEYTIRYEPSADYHEQFLSIPDGTALRGYFQSYKYFNNIRATIQKEFSFKQSIQQKVRNQYQSINSENSVAIHIRLGDYQDVCQQWVYPKNFWLNVMKKLRENSGGRAVFIVVSDDPQIEFDEEWILRHRGNRFEDLAVLAGCKFIAGPPSTFNRWAAFVGGKPHYCVNRTDFMPSIEDFMQFKLSSNNPLKLNIKEINAIRWHGIA